MAGDDTIITDDIRAAGRAVLDRMAIDSDYAARLIEEPVPLLVEAGIPEAVMPALAAGILDNAEVSGFGLEVLNPSGGFILKQTNPTAFGNTDAYGRNYWYS